MCENNLIITKSLIAQANDLANEHEKLDMHMAVGRQMLYDLLAKIYALSVQLEASIDREFFVRRMKDELASKWGIKTQENTSDTTALVRYITRADRKTAHVYSRAIEAAKVKQVKESSFTGFVERQGGIERIRSESVAVKTAGVVDPEVELAQEQRELTRSYLNARRECPYSSFKISMKTNDLSTPQNLNFFVCSEKDGRYYVLAQLSVSDDVSNKLIQDFAENMCADIQSSRKNISEFTRKASKKRGQATLKSLIRKLPSLKGSVSKGSGKREALLINPHEDIA